MVTKIPLVSVDKKKMSERVLPPQFAEAYRPDLIHRAVLALQSAARQRYGAFPLAGKRPSAETSKRRHDYRGTYGQGISRVKRKVLSRRGSRFSWVGAVTPQTKGGRRAHPPKVEKNYEKKLNKKENRKAVRSAMGATLSRSLVMQRGHHVPEEYPFIIGTAFEDLKTTKEVQAALRTLGFAEELQRSLVKKIRAGIGKLRGRRYKKKKGLLLVVGDEQCALLKAARNIPGLDVVPVRAINAELLAPGALPGRAALWTEKALDVLEKEKLFI